PCTMASASTHCTRALAVRSRHPSYRSTEGLLLPHDLRSTAESGLNRRAKVISGSHQSKYLFRSSLVSRHTRLKGRVVESAGIRSYREHSGQEPFAYPPLEWMGWWPTRHRPIARAWNDLSLRF